MVISVEINIKNIKSPSKLTRAVSLRIGIKKRAVKDREKYIIGEMVKIGFSTPSGVISSFERSFKKSAIGCKTPEGPVYNGPNLLCILATTFLSTHSEIKAKRIRNAAPGKINN